MSKTFKDSKKVKQNRERRGKTRMEPYKKEKYKESKEY